MADTIQFRRPWPQATPPGIATQHPIPAHAMRIVTEALRAVDADIERTGTVSAETVTKVRATLVDLMYAEALRAACALATPQERRYACDAAHAKYEAALEELGIELAA